MSLLHASRKFVYTFISNQANRENHRKHVTRQNYLLVRPHNCVDEFFVANATELM